MKKLGRGPQGDDKYQISKLYKEILCTKYKRSRPSSLREEEFKFAFFVQNCDPGGRASFDPRDIL